MCTVCSLWARSRGGWSQVISGVVTLGRLSPRPRARAPVRPYFVRVRVRARGIERVRAWVRACALLLGGVGGVALGVGVVWCRCGGVVWWRHTFFSFYLSSGGGGGVLLCSVLCSMVCFCGVLLWF